MHRRFNSPTQGKFIPDPKPTEPVRKFGYKKKKVRKYSPPSFAQQLSTLNYCGPSKQLAWWDGTVTLTYWNAPFNWTSMCKENTLFISEGCPYLFIPDDVFWSYRVNPLELWE